MRSLTLAILVISGLWLNGCCVTCMQRPTADTVGWPAELQARFDAEVPGALEREDIPGAVILVGHREGNDWVTWSKSYGQMERVPEERSMREDAIFDLASMTKPIATGTSLMILQDRGLLSVDDPVSIYLPEYDTPEKRDVRIRDLMTHSSGLQSYIGTGERQPLVEAHGEVCPDALRTYIREIELQHAPPNSVTVYSCLNAITTAQIVERVSGQPLDEFTRENIWEPLGMRDTDFSPGPSPRVVPTQMTDDGLICGMVHDPLAKMQAGVSGNAGLFSTAQDISIFAQMMLQGGERDGVRILSEDAIEQMTSAQLPESVTTPGGSHVDRGLLWQVYLPSPGDEGIETIPHYGHTGYTGTAIRIWPSEQFYVIALTNRVHPDDSARVAAFRNLCWTTAGEVVCGVDDSVVVLKPWTPSWEVASR